MSSVKIEELLSGGGFTFERQGDRKWKFSREGNGLTGFLEWADNSGGGLLRIYTPMGRLPADAEPQFFKEIFRKNRDMGHGAFALMDGDEVVFIDTLELEHCDHNEMDATMNWLLKSSGIFRERLDRSKLPYIDAL